MKPTAFTFVILPLCLLWIGNPRRLLQLTLIAAVFEAAAALIIGSLGVQPGLPPAFTFLGYVVLQMLLGAKFPGHQQVIRITTPFILVTLWAVISSYVMPRLFDGDVMVWPQKQLPPFTLEALHPSSNFNQDAYLVVNCALLVLTASYLTRALAPLTLMLNTFLFSGVVVAAVSMWQFANRVAGIPFPEEVFFSNPGWAILTAQSIGRVPRINGPFAEPSALAGYMASIVCATGWVIIRGEGTRMIRIIFLLGLLTMFISTSTTGFGVLALAAAGVIAYALFSGSLRMLAGILRIALPLVVLFGVIAIGASAMIPSFNRNVAEVLTATLNKQDSSSYNDRTSTDVDSLAAGFASDGLGVGWGSNRSSSLLPGLFSNLGIPGLVGLAWFAGLITAQVRIAGSLRPPREQARIIHACCGGIVGFLLGALLSGPTISSVTFYLLIALLIGCTTRIRLNAAQESSVTAYERESSEIEAGI